MLLSEALDRFLLALEGVRSGATVIWYRRRLSSLVDFLADPDARLVATHDLNRWRASLNGGVSTWTLHGYVRAARRFFGWLVDEGVLESSPARRLELPRLPREPRKGIADDDRDRMIEAARRSGARDYALVWFLNDTLCRVGGVAGLRVRDLDLERGEAIVNEKGEKGRAVFLGDEAVAALRDWLEERRPQSADDHVFTGQRGPLTEWGVYQVLERLAKKAGVKEGWNPHNWRHAGARSMLQNGASLGHVSQILGHSDVSVTDRFYGTFAHPELKRAHERFRPKPNSPKDSSAFGD